MPTTNNKHVSTKVRPGPVAGPSTQQGPPNPTQTSSLQMPRQIPRGPFQPVFNLPSPAEGANPTATQHAGRSPTEQPPHSRESAPTPPSRQNTVRAKPAMPSENPLGKDQSRLPAYEYFDSEEFPYENISYKYPVVEPLQEDDAKWLEKMFTAIVFERRRLQQELSETRKEAAKMAAELLLARMELKAEEEMSRNMYTTMRNIVGPYEDLVEDAEQCMLNTLEQQAQDKGQASQLTDDSDNEPRAEQHAFSTPANQSHRPAKRGREHDDYDLVGKEKKHHRTENSSPAVSPTPARVSPVRASALARTDSVDSTFAPLHPVHEWRKGAPSHEQARNGSEDDDPFFSEDSGAGPSQEAPQPERHPFLPQTPKAKTPGAGNAYKIFPTRLVGHTPFVTPFREARWRDTEEASQDTTSEEDAVEDKDEEAEAERTADLSIESSVSQYLPRLRRGFDRQRAAAAKDAAAQELAAQINEQHPRQHARINAASAAIS